MTWKKIYQFASTTKRVSATPTIPVFAQQKFSLDRMQKKVFQLDSTSI